MDTQITITATVDVAESIRRGKPAPSQSVSISLPALLALLTEDERKEVARRIRMSDRGDDRATLSRWPALSHQGTIASIPTAEAEGLAEAVRVAIAEERAEVAERVRREHEAQEALRALAQRIGARPILALEIPNGALGRDYTDPAGAITFLVRGAAPFAGRADTTRDYQRAEPLLPDSTRAEVARIVRTVAQESARLAKEAQAAAYAARLARLVPHLDAEEQAMQARGYLALSHVESRLDDEAIEALRARVEPPGYVIEIASPGAERKPASREEFRLLRRIETLTGLAARLTWAVCTTSAEVVIVTADGRTLTVAISPEPEE